MKPCRFFCWIACLALTPAFGQVTVELVQPQTQFLIGEAIPLAVKITNRSGQTLRFGEQEGWLSFGMEYLDGANTIVAKTEDVPVAGAFDLETSKRATKRILNLAPYFAVDNPGPYSVTATVYVRELDREVVSAPKKFNVIQGTRIWEREIGLPSSSAEGDKPSVRRYTLQQANFQKRQLKLYLKVYDVTSTRLVKLSQLGNMVSFSKPEPQVDKNSRLHVLFQDGPHSCKYAVCDPDGEIIKQEVYDFSGTRPRLKQDIEGEFYVTGGIIRKKEDAEPALPPSEPAASEAPKESES